MKIGTALGLSNPKYWLDIVLQADQLGYESVWMPEHLVFPVDVKGSPFSDQEHPPVPPETPLYDAFVYLSFFAGQTKNIRLGTNVYLLGLRHPFISARAIQTFDIVSNGRAEIGVGAGWLRSEWHAAELDPKTRGKRLDEAIDVCKKLWTEDVIQHEGDFYKFAPVKFEPKPVQKPYPPLHIGGESEAALKRAIMKGDGWYGLSSDMEQLNSNIKYLHTVAAEQGRDLNQFEITIGAKITNKDDIKRFEDMGVTRLIVQPWARGKDAAAGLQKLADTVF